MIRPAGEHGPLPRIRRGLRDYRPPPLLGEHPDAAVAVALTDAPADPGLLLTRRAEHLMLHPGEVAFPGGKYETGDGDLLSTAIREMWEEVGIGGEHFEPLGQLRPRLTRSEIRVTPYVGIIPSTPSLHINPGEIDTAFVLPLSALAEPRRITVEPVWFRGQRREVVRIRYRGHEIWGVTAMIIIDLMNTVLDAGLPVDETRR